MILLFYCSLYKTFKYLSEMQYYFRFTCAFLGNDFVNFYLFLDLVLKELSQP